MTLPLAPLSLPEMTSTVSPLCTFMSEHLRGQRDDLHELLVAQLAAHGAEDASAARIVVRLDEHGGVLVELDVGTVRTAALIDGAHDDGLHHVTPLDVAAGDGVLHGGADGGADTGIATRRTTENADAEDFLRTRVVGDAQSRLLLNHFSLLDLDVKARRIADPTGMVVLPPGARAYQRFLTTTGGSRPSPRAERPRATGQV